MTSWVLLRPLGDLHFMLAAVLLFVYLSAAAWLIISVRGGTNTLSAHGNRLTGISLAMLAWLLHGYALCEWVFRTGNLALSLLSAASLISWISVALVLAKTLQQPRFDVLAAVVLAASGALAALSHFSQPTYRETDTDGALLAHVVLAVLAYALITIGSLMALALTLLDRRLHQHQPLGWLGQLPSVEALESAMFQAIRAGFALLTLTLLTGFVFVDNLFAQHLAHKTILSCVAWVLLGILLLGRYRLGWRGHTAARWVLSSFILLVLAYFGSKLVLENFLGKHWS